MTSTIKIAVLALCVLTISANTSAKYKLTGMAAEIAENLQSLPLPTKLPIPVEGISPSDLKDTWGASRSQGRSHEGIDIIAPRGAQVFSTTEGLVYSMKHSALGGKNVWILGPNGAFHYYAHLDSHREDLQVGDYVKQGDLLGYVGNTGNARHTSPHLHYSIYLNGKGSGPVNPFPYLR